MLQLATNAQGKIFALKQGKVVGRVFQNDDNLTEYEFYRVYEGWADVIQLSANPPNPLWYKPSEIFSNWDLPLGIHSGASVAISTELNDLLPYVYGEHFRG